MPRHVWETEKASVFLSGVWCGFNGQDVELPLKYYWLPSDAPIHFSQFVPSPLVFIVPPQFLWISYSKTCALEIEYIKQAALFYLHSSQRLEPMPSFFFHQGAQGSLCRVSKFCRVMQSLPMLWPDLAEFIFRAKWFRLVSSNHAKENSVMDNSCSFWKLCLWFYALISTHFTWPLNLHYTVDWL